MNLYHVYHQRPREIRPGVGETQIGLERAEIARVPLQGLAAVVRFMDGPRNVEVVPVGNSPQVCGLCQEALPVPGDDLCGECIGLRDRYAEVA